MELEDYRAMGRRLKQVGYTLAGTDGHKFGRFYGTLSDATRACIKANKLGLFGIVVLAPTTLLEQMNRC